MAGLLWAQNHSPLSGEPVPEAQREADESEIEADMFEDPNQPAELAREAELQAREDEAELLLIEG